MVADGAIEQVDMGAGFRPYRRAVGWLSSLPAPIRPLLDEPGFALSGARLRYGLVKIDLASMAAIATAMGIPHDETAQSSVSIPEITA